jgi:hypothetical protein
VEYFHFFILVYSGQFFCCPPGSLPALFLATHSCATTVSKSSLGQLSACGPFPEGFAQSVVVVVSAVIPPFIGSSSVVVVLFGGRAATGVATEETIIVTPIANTTASKVILVFMFC